MKWTGKIVGALIGLIFAHPLTVMLGLFIGHLYDIGWLGEKFRLGVAAQNTRTQTIFFNASFMVMGYLAKCDGRVSASEIRIASKVMDDMNLSSAMKREAIRLFNVGKEAGFNLDRVLTQLRMACWTRPGILRIFIEMQIRMAYADGQRISDEKRQALTAICRKFGIAGFRFSQFEEQQRAEQNYQRYQYQHSHQHQHASPFSHLNDAYRILGVSPSADDAEVKKAYRRLMSQHHPDKLIAKGLPPEMIKIATQKTQQIKKAYEQICQVRKG